MNVHYCVLFSSTVTGLGLGLGFDLVSGSANVFVLLSIATVTLSSKIDRVQNLSIQIQFGIITEMAQFWTSEKWEGPKGKGRTE